MTEATLMLTPEGLYEVEHDGLKYESTPNGSVIGALLWLLEPDALRLRGRSAENLRQLHDAHKSLLGLAYSITASLAPNLQSPMSRPAVEALLLNACALCPPPHHVHLMQKTADLLERIRPH